MHIESIPSGSECSPDSDSCVSPRHSSPPHLVAGSQHAQRGAAQPHSLPQQVPPGAGLLLAPQQHQEQVSGGLRGLVAGQALPTTHAPAHSLVCPPLQVLEREGQVGLQGGAKLASEGPHLSITKTGTNQRQEPITDRNQSTADVCTVPVEVGSCVAGRRAGSEASVRWQHSPEDTRS